MAKHDLGAPARLLWRPTAPESMRDWEGARAFESLREAVTDAITREPVNQTPWILAEDTTLDRSEIKKLWQEINPSV
jgi:hypothetical protein